MEDSEAEEVGIKRLNIPYRWISTRIRNHSAEDLDWNPREMAMAQCDEKGIPVRAGAEVAREFQVVMACPPKPQWNTSAWGNQEKAEALWLFLSMTEDVEESGA
jgi:hypothetical protein